LASNFFFLDSCDAAHGAPSMWFSPPPYPGIFPPTLFLAPLLENQRRPVCRSFLDSSSRRRVLTAVASFGPPFLVFWFYFWFITRCIRPRPFYFDRSLVHPPNGRHSAFGPFCQPPLFFPPSAARSLASPPHSLGEPSEARPDNFFWDLFALSRNVP